MQVQWKVVLLVGALVASTIGAIFWRATTLVPQEKAQFVAESSQKQIAPVRRLITAKLETAREQMLSFARARERGITPAFGDFDAVAFVIPSENKAAPWATKWVSRNTTARVPEAVMPSLISGLPFARVKDGEMHWVGRPDRANRPLYVLMVAVQLEVEVPAAQPTPSPTPVPGENSESITNALPDAPVSATAQTTTQRGILVGVFNDNPLAGVSDDFIGSLQTVYVVDEAAYVISHSLKSYVGTRFTEDDVVKEIMKGAGRVTSGSGNYEDFERQKVSSFWERADKTNLYAVVSTPNRAVESMANHLINTIIWIGIAAGVLAILTAAWLGSQLTSGLQRIQAFVQAWNMGQYQPSLLPTERSDELGQISRALIAVTSKGPTSGDQLSIEPAIGDSKDSAAAETPLNLVDVYRQLAMGLSVGLREPVASILGNIQLLKKKISGAESELHAATIERETRAVKSVVDALTRIAGEEDMQLRPLQPADVIEVALSNLSREFGIASVKVNSDVQKTPLINGSAIHFQAAFEALCRQAVESMRTRPNKELQVRLVSQDDRVRLSVIDSGVGLSREKAVRYFEPFANLYEGTKSAGLQLAMARALFERHYGEVRVDSVPGTGTSVHIEFPVSAHQQVEGEKPTSNLAPASPNPLAGGVSPSPISSLKPPPPVIPLSVMTEAIGGVQNAERETANAPEPEAPEESAAPEGSSASEASTAPEGSSAPVFNLQSIVPEKSPASASTKPGSAANANSDLPSFLSPQEITNSKISLSAEQTEPQTASKKIGFPIKPPPKGTAKPTEPTETEAGTGSVSAFTMSSVTLGGKALASSGVEQNFPPSPDAEITPNTSTGTINPWGEPAGAPLDLSRTAAPKDGEMPMIELPQELQSSVTVNELGQVSSDTASSIMLNPLTQEAPEPHTQTITDDSSSEVAQPFSIDLTGIPSGAPAAEPALDLSALEANEVSLPSFDVAQANSEISVDAGIPSRFAPQSEPDLEPELEMPVEADPEVSQDVETADSAEPTGVDFVTQTTTQGGTNRIKIRRPKTKG